MMINYFINKFKSNKAVTGVDVAISITIILIFTGILANIMYASYKLALDTQVVANADAYATIILERIDERPFDEIDNDFYNKMKSTEISGNDSSNYTVSLNVEPFGQYMIDGNNIFKKVTLTVKYRIGEREERSITINKLKVREAGE